MNVVLITEASGLIGSETVNFFSNKVDRVLAIDNSMREDFFCKDASTLWNLQRLKEKTLNHVY